MGKWYLESRFNDRGKVSTQIINSDEVKEFDTTPFSICEGYDRYVDDFDTYEEALEAKKEAEEA